MNPVAVQIPLDQIKVMVSRAREREGWQQLKASMADVGLKIPVQVRREDRGVKYELIVGEGRVTAARALGWKTIPALIIEADEAEFAGRFLAENMIREPLPWAVRGRMIRDELQAGATMEDVCKRLHISENLGRKYYRVVSNAAQPEVEALPVNVAEVLTTLPKKNQTIVLRMAETEHYDVKEVTAKAKELDAKGGDWTQAELRKALRRAEEELPKFRKRLKLLRHHWSLGPQNLETLLAMKGFRAACVKAGVNLSKLSEA